MLFQTGFRFSPINYDMTCGHLPNYFNLQANMYMADSLARTSLYNVPMFNMGSMMPYGGVSIPGDLIFQSVLGQAHYQSLQNGGAGIFNSDGTLNLTGNIFGGYGFGSQLGTSYNPFGGIGFTPWQTPGVDNGNGNGSGKTDAEREAEQQMKDDYDVIKAILVAYKKANADEIDSDLKRKIENAISKTGKVEDKYNAVKDTYEAIDKDSLRKVFPTMDAYRETLINVGFDFTDNDYTLGYGKEERETEANELKTALDEIYQELNSITPGDLDFTAEKYLGKFNGVNKDDILNLISTWNEKYNNEDEKLLQLVIKKLPLTDEGEAGKRKTAIDNAVKPVTLALINKANDVVNASKGVDTKPLARQAEKLNRALAKFANDSKDEGKADTLVAEFDVLYVMLRKYEAHLVDKKIAKDYKLLNELNEENQVEINNNIMNATVADLESEELGGIKFKVRVTRSNSGTKFTTKEVMENLAEDKYAVQKVEVEGEGVTYYVELEVTGDRTTRRAFAVVGDDIKVVGEYDKTNNTITEYSEENQSKVTASSIEKDYEKAIEKMEEREVASQDGEDYMYSLSGGNSSTEASNAFAKVSENNIIELLDGIYSADSGNEWWRDKGFFLRGLKDGSITFEIGKKIVEAILDKASKYGLTNSQHYENLKEINDYYKDAGSSATDFNKFNWKYLYKNQRVIEWEIKYLYDEIKEAQIKNA